MPLVNCFGVIWSNQTRCRLGCWARTIPWICCQVPGSKECELFCEACGPSEAAADARRADGESGRVEGEWVVSMATLRFQNCQRRPIIGWRDGGLHHRSADARAPHF